MLSPQLRRKVFELWSLFWSAGMTNPLTAVEQITYLIFLKNLEARDQERVSEKKRSFYARRKDCKLKHEPGEDDKNVDQSIPEGQDPEDYKRCIGHGTARWSYIRQNPSYELLNDSVFPWLRDLEKTLADLRVGQNGTPEIGDRMADAYFQLAREKTTTLKTAISIIDELFQHEEAGRPDTDLLGDIFEYLLDEIKSSGKNGQFRTPRHIVRFMVNLLDPKWEPDEVQPRRIIDPAAGTGGFLFASIDHLKAAATPPENLRIEWDGTPHRAFGGDLRLERALVGSRFVGYDNDRTMVRIGWMNLILHGIDDPWYTQRDTLGTGSGKEDRPLESESYRYLLTNPPFTGNVDEKDLNQERFVFLGGKVKKPLTTKSELLFVWLALNLLETGGEAAMIVPEGVLFGSTTAHRALRQKLLFENELKGVISLPGGVFQPYTGVKTSILIFRKYGATLPGGEPRTQGVWFYEVSDDGLTLDAKRDPKPTPNDLWDALAKYPARAADSTAYYQPVIYKTRWRFLDDDARKVFLEEEFPGLSGFESRPYGLDELFGLPEDPQQATEQVVAEQRPVIEALYREYMESAEAEAAKVAATKRTAEQRRRAAEQALTAALRQLNRHFTDATADKEGSLLERGYNGFGREYGRKALKPLLDEAREAAAADLPARADRAAEPRDLLTVEPEEGVSEQPAAAPPIATADEAWKERVRQVAVAFARLDGDDVQLLRDPGQLTKTDVSESKSWIAPVRVIARDDAWEFKDEAGNLVKGSHDETGQVRPEYLNWPELRNEDKTIKAEYLDPDCIEANDLNLSAGTYKPFTLTASEHEPPQKIIEELQKLEVQIQAGLVELLAVIEGAE